MFQARRLPALCLAFLVSLATSTVEAQSSPSPRVLDSARLDYRDEDGGRPNAAVEATLVRREDGAELLFFVSANDPAIEPPRGFEGRRGSNRITAEEFAMLQSGVRDVFGESENLDTQERHAGRARVHQRGRLPIRRLHPDGRIDYHALTCERLPVGLLLRHYLPGDGVYTSRWLVDGDTRLTARVEVNGQRGRISSLAGHEPRRPGPRWEPVPKRRSPFAVFATASQDFARAPGRTAAPAVPDTPPVPIAEWEQRDLEGRWLLFSEATRKDPASVRQWVHFLAKRREFQLLEWIALYRHRSFYKDNIGALLQKANAPQWIRVTVWTLASADGHTAESAEARLLLDNPHQVRAWFDKYPQAATGYAKKIYAQLRTEPAETVDLGGILPPLKQRDVFAALDAPPELSDFGDRLRAEAGKRYVHQVYRALDGLKALSRHHADQLAQLAKLESHPHVHVRQRAILTYSYLPAQLIPHERLHRLLHDRNAPASVREAATLSFSYAAHPSVYATLHQLAENPNHPCWKAAFSRLGDIGDEFTLTLLGSVKFNNNAEAARFAAEELKRIRARVEQDRSRGISAVLRSIRPRLERAAWVDLMCHPLERSLVPWVSQSIRAVADDPKVRSYLLKLLKSYRPSTVEKTRFGRMETRVKRYIREILELEE